MAEQHELQEIQEQINDVRSMLERFTGPKSETWDALRELFQVIEGLGSNKQESWDIFKELFVRSEQETQRVDILEQQIAQLVGSSGIDERDRDEMPAVEDEVRTAYTNCQSHPTHWNENDDPDGGGRTIYQPYEYLDLEVTHYPYWDGQCIMFLYWKLRFRAGKLISVIEAVKDECQEACVVCATDCVTLADPECEEY